ncbi:PKD domain-containing protein [bacterium]|nr:PKD domain-containing protein [bacterium]
MPSNNHHSVIAAALAMLLLSACGSGDKALEGSARGPLVSEAPQSGRVTPAQPPQAAAPLKLAGPTQLLAQRGASFTLADGYSDGADFDPGLPSNRVSPAGTTAGFIPDFGPGDSGLGNLAYCVYAFSLPDYNNDAPVDIQLTFSDAPAAGDCYVALSDFDGGFWSWFSLPGDGRLLFPGFTEYISPSDIHLLCVAIRGSDAAILDSIQISTEQPPVASIVPDSDSGIAPLTVQFDGSASMDPDGTLVNFEWDLDGDGLFNETGAEQTAAGQNMASATYSTPGSYDVTLRVTDDADLQDEATVQINVSASQPPVADLQASPTSGDKPVVVTFNATASMDPDGTVTDYEWDFDGDSNFNEADNGEAAAQGDPTPPDVSYTVVGSFDATVRVTDNDGGKDTAVQTINVTNSGPNAVLSTDLDEGDAPFMVDFNASGSTDPGGMIVDYEWDFDGDGLFNEVGTEEETERGNSTPADVQYNDPGEISAAVRVSDDDGASDTAVKPIIAHGWDFVTLPTTGSGGIWATVAEIGGNPAICFRDNTATTLHYIRSTNALGTEESDWSTPVQVSAAANSGWRSVMLEVEGNPAILHYNVNSMTVHYSRANTSTGTTAVSWSAGTSITIDSSGSSTFEGLSAAIVSGNPALAYFNGTSGSLRYVRSATTTGANAADWSGLITVDSAANHSIGRWCSLAVISGNPAIIYVDEDTNIGSEITKFARASNTTGQVAANWTGGTKASVDAGNGMLYMSLAEVSGQPGFVMQDDAGVGFKFRRAKTSTGGAAADWSGAGSSNFVLDPGNESGLYGSLGFVNSLPVAVHVKGDGMGSRTLRYFSSNSIDGDALANWTGEDVLTGTSPNGDWVTLAEINGHPAVAFRATVGSAMVYGYRF